jgi:hypothetical protein
MHEHELHEKYVGMTTASFLEKTKRWHCKQIKKN